MYINILYYIYVYIYNILYLLYLCNIIECCIIILIIIYLHTSHSYTHILKIYSKKKNEFALFHIFYIGNMIGNLP